MLAISRASHRFAVKSRAAITRAADRLKKREDGVAAVEFALIVPIMAIMLIGAIEMSAAVTVDRRVSQIAATTGDLTARFDGMVTPSDIQKVANIGSWILGVNPDDAARLSVRLRLVTVQCLAGDVGTSNCTSGAPVPNTYGGQKTRWECNFGAGVNAPAGQNNLCFCNTSGNADGGPGEPFVTPRQGLVEFNTSPAVVVSDVAYNYCPKFFDTFMGGANSSATVDGTCGNFKTFRLTERLYHKPRGAEIKMNADGTTVSGSNTCNGPLY